MPGAASPALDGATEERIEAMVAERLHAKLVESMRKARDHGRQKVRAALWYSWTKRLLPCCHDISLCCSTMLCKRVYLQQVKVACRVSIRPGMFQKP